MFVASSLYSYARGSSSPARGDGSTPANTRIKRQPIRKRGSNKAPTSPPPSYASVAAGQSSTEDISIEGRLANEERQRLRTAAEVAKIAVIDSIVAKEDLYEVLGVKRNAKAEEIRRGFLNRSRVCHPDKFPSYAPCVVAFQKVSFAYQTLSKPSSRRLYDVSGRMDLAAALNENGTGVNGAGAGLGGEETLNSVLYSVFCEFLDGDFQMIRVLVNALNESNPGLNLGEDAVDSIEGAFAKLRELMMAGKKYLTIIRFELIRLYEIQHSLRQLSYFDVFGRLRLTLQLARVTLSIPMAIDQAMKEPEDGEEINLAADGDLADGEKTREDGHHGDDEDDSSSGNEDDERVEADFGMRVSDGDNDSDDDRGMSAENRARDRKARRRGARRARVEAARRARIKEQEQMALQRKGLLGPTAASLLKTAVKVLETSEGWVPGRKQDKDSDD